MFFMNVHEEEAKIEPSEKHLLKLEMQEMAVFTKRVEENS